MDEQIDSGPREPAEQRQDANRQQPAEDNQLQPGEQAATTAPDTLEASQAAPEWPGVGDQSVTIYRPRLFFRKDLGFWKHFAIMAPMSLIPSLAIAFALASTGLLTQETGPKFSGPGISAPVMVFSVMVISPAVETLIMAFIIWLLSFVTGNKTKLAILSAIVWGIFHSLAAPMWGFAVAWPFFVFSCGYLNWKDKSLWHGLGMGMALHGFQNILPGIFIAMGYA